MVNIHSNLKEQITTKHTINPSFGKACYFEFVFTNPYNRDCNFEITWDDSELRFEEKLIRSLVADSTEWKYLRKIHDIKVGVEDKLLSLNPNGTAVVFMIPNESVSIPFVYQSFLSGYSKFNSDDEDLCRILTGSGIPETPIHARTISVFIDLTTGVLPQ